MDTSTPTCPFCESTDVRKIVYGLIRFKSAEEKSEFEKNYVMGGCVVGGEDPAYHCAHCQKDFGTIDNEGD